ncbi:MAG TPA: VOC family protein [Planctomycetota bacterium]|nr:VOC family protein [Planctomycetota bacterium]
MDVAGFDHVNLTVRDFEESVAWYRRLFRFELVEEGVRDGVRWGILRSGGGRGSAMLCIYERPDFRGADPELLGSLRLHGIRHFGLRVDDGARWRALLERERIQTEVARWPHSTSWYLSDPTGHEIEVACWKEGQVEFESDRKEEP